MVTSSPLGFPQPNQLVLLHPKAFPCWNKSMFGTRLVPWQCRQPQSSKRRWPPGRSATPTTGMDQGHRWAEPRAETAPRSSRGAALPHSERKVPAVLQEWWQELRLQPRSSPWIYSLAKIAVFSCCVSVNSYTHQEYPKWRQTKCMWSFFLPKICHWWVCPCLWQEGGRMSFIQLITVSFSQSDFTPL